MPEMRLFSYKLTHDTGFAPNPFWGYLTLATCKPGIRQSKDVGDWIAGFSSKSLCGDRIGEERLVYLMKVAEKLLIGDYFNDPRFTAKISKPEAGSEVYRSGDNIYRPLCADASQPQDFEQLPNSHHWDGAGSCSTGDSKKRDTSGTYVLVAAQFAYFGRQSLFIPPELRPAIPYGV